MRTLRRLVAIVLPLVAVGCSAPTATLDLIGVGRQGLASAREAQVQGLMIVKCKVLADGTVQDCRVIKTRLWRLLPPLVGARWVSCG